MTTMINPITYPARPINGGPLDQAPEKSGVWFYEPKYNGWRALVHVPSGAMFNRNGELLTIADEFKQSLDAIKLTPFEWVDCEALERRHEIGRGSLIVLDAPTHGTYRERRQWLEDYFRPDIGPWFFQDQSVYLPPKIEASIAPKAWNILQVRNAQVGCQFYEGLVAKKADSIYPIQLRSPKLEFPFWVKHRWAY